jgi:putative sporulation protein YtaF
VVPAAVIHHFWDVTTIALANNVDNLGARIAYSIRGIKIGVAINLWIAVITFLISSAAALSGSAAAEVLGTTVAPVTAMVLLVTLGIWMLVQPGRQRRQGNYSASRPADRPLEKPQSRLREQVGLKEGTILGIALSINNIGGGISAGILGINPYLVGALSALVSFLALWGGNYFAILFARWRMADNAGMVGGLLLIGLGVKQVVG